MQRHNDFYVIYLEGGPCKSFDNQIWVVSYKRVENLYFRRSSRHLLYKLCDIGLFLRGSHSFVTANFTYIKDLITTEVMKMSNQLTQTLPPSSSCRYFLQLSPGAIPFLLSVLSQNNMRALISHPLVRLC